MNSNPLCLSIVGIDFLFACRLKIDREQLAAEKAEMQRQYVMVSASNDDFDVSSGSA